MKRINTYPNLRTQSFTIEVNVDTLSEHAHANALSLQSLRDKFVEDAGKLGFTVITPNVTELGVQVHA